MSFKKITYAVSDDIATIAFDDPNTLNAAGMDTIEELTLAFEQAADSARCTILTGNGRGFCSGANLSSDVGQRPKGKPDAGKGLDTHYNPFIKAMRTHPHPIITAVNGAAAGVGCSIALMGDFIIAGQSGYFLQAFRRIGLVPDGGSTFLLPRMLGRARAMEMTLFGEKIFADQAHALVEPGSAGQLAEAMKARLDAPDHFQQAAEQLKQSVEPRFSIATMSAIVERAYRELLVAQTSTSPETGGQMTLNPGNRP